jgi:hypothetical protein
MRYPFYWNISPNLDKFIFSYESDAAGYHFHFSGMSLFPVLRLMSVLFLSEYPAACCGWDGQETDLRMIAYSL